MCILLFCILETGLVIFFDYVYSSIIYINFYLVKEVFSISNYKINLKHPG